VFDAAMLVALWQFDTEDLVAGLLLFRVLYYLVPFGISLTILGCREIWLSVHAARKGKYPSPYPPPNTGEGREGGTASSDEPPH
jgi:hypothetical protein